MGVVKGFGSGLAGAVVKPVLGVAGGVSSVVQGISNQSSDGPEAAYYRPARAFERAGDDLSQCKLATIDLLTARVQERVILEGRKERETESYHALTIVFPHVVVLGEKRIYLFKLSEDGKSIADTAWILRYGDVSHCVYRPELSSIVFVEYRRGGLDDQGPQVQCSTTESALQVYSMLHRVRSRFGNAMSMIAPDVHKANAAQGAADPSDGGDDAAPGEANEDEARATPAANTGTTSAAAVSWLHEYQFGTVNGRKFPAIRGTERDVLTRGEERFRNFSSCVGTPVELVRALDECVWQLIQEWVMMHKNLNYSRCCTTLIINNSQNPVYISRFQMEEGRKFEVFGVGAAAGGGLGGYDAESRNILPGGGAAVVFCYGFRPSPLDLAHVKLNIVSSAFECRMSTRQDRTYCHPKGGFAASFLEKSLTEWWGKYVIAVA